MSQVFLSMATRKRIGFSEREIMQRWQGLVGKEMITEEGRRLKVIYPGRTNRNVGPDFRNATILMNESELVKGDVEIHVRSSDWYGHGHHYDPEYDQVILHVVLWHDCESPTLVQDGSSVPIATLSEADFMSQGQLPCFRMMDDRDSQTLRSLLDAAGQNRFEQKAALFQTRRGREEAEQVLYRGIMRALGYSRNVKPFEELADRLPIKFLECIESREGLPLKQALLLGTAGLLPSEWLRKELSVESEVKQLDQIWRALARGKPMSPGAWHLSHVYPKNSPVRRIMAQSHLLQRYHEKGLLMGILQLVDGTPLTGGHRRLEDGLVISSPKGSSALLGHSKAAEIIVNIILPFVFSWAESFLEAGLGEKALKLYLSYPRLAENEITRHMARQLCLEDTTDFTACRQQGLIHIFRDYCCEGGCSKCPLNSQGRG